MLSSFYSYQESNDLLTETAFQVRESWSDDVGAKFFSVIIEPMRMEAYKMRCDMQVLIVTLQKIKTEIDAI
ncbi:MAG: hypothetical protein IKW83_11205 [Muribaculaceae bacterium]|nr:hypothetical protein [Muribaculaceae bacterium]